MEDKLHYTQDALESYCVYKLTSLAEKNNLALKNDSDKKLSDYESYCQERNINPSVDSTGKVYFNMFEEHLPNFFEDLKNRYPNSKFDFMDVEKDFRNENKKGDFLMIVDGENYLEISFSLKAYKGGFSRIQVCSGTFNSFITNFLFKPAGVGMFETLDGVKFKGSNVSVRDKEIEKLGYNEIVPKVQELDDILKEVKDYFVRGDEAKNYFNKGVSGKNVGEEWSEGHYTYGNRGIKISLDILKNSFTEKQIKDRLVKMIGFDGDEELLLLDKKQYTSSVTNTRMMNLIRNIRSNDTTVSFDKVGKSIRFSFNNNNETILEVDVPFCLDKNGAWWLPKDKKSVFKKKDNCVVHYGQRRPKKSKELSLSTNTYVNLKSAGII